VSRRFERHLDVVIDDLTRYCRGAVRDRAEADDVLQEAVLNAFRQFERFQAGTSFRSFVFRCAVHEMLNRSRATAVRRGRETRHPDGSGAEAAALEEELDHEQVLADPANALEHCGDAVRAAFLDLRPLDRSIFRLKSVGGFDGREIATFLDLP
jgi:RNA polymerase sigma-70 factor (ECF subfamily)